MRIDQYLKIVQTGQGLKAEFKEGLSPSIAKDIVAFANQKGGRILVGISDEGSITGYKYKDRAKLNDMLNSIKPNIDNITTEYQHFVLVINIPEGKNKPYSTNNEFYLRIGSTSQRVNREDIRKKSQPLFGERHNNKFSIEDDLSEEALNNFLERSNLSTEIPRERLFRNLSLKDNESLNNAGVLFFCKDVRRFFLNATVVCVLYKGSSEVDILDKKEFTGDFLSNYHNTLNYLYNKLNTEYIIKKERTERLELPEEALREVLINAMVHRDYFSTAHVQVDIYHNRVEISNPGNLLFDKKYLGKKSVPRNPIMMDLLLRADYVERIGSGIKRIEQAMDSYNLDFDIDADEFFVVTLNRKEQIERKSDENQTEIPEGNGF
ncbi:MAG: putative DNA binding domain-containing protein [Candidatus Marinimicrobia bacterium]|nr:putative DNA binding domain-containing protein [Candidatus Neomarinimicrobiota bacterium]